ncbi:hypothetical protein CBW16_02565 [Flavobacteriaceae bacterium JJC]|nr:hypothetical protein CBW16_02565 [Flavobacteriaceae bacterium JJC]
MSKKNLSERDICTKFITPAIEKAGWEEGIKFLRIKWYVTYCDDCRDIPRTIERDLIAAFKSENNGIRPKWNKQD